MLGTEERHELHTRRVVEQINRRLGITRAAGVIGQEADALAFEPSKTFTGKWDTGNIYSPPARRWNFDTNFSTKSPPGGLNSVVYTRGTWAKF